MGVAETTIAALGQTELLTFLDHVHDQGLVVFLEDLRADRHSQRHAFAIGAGTVATHAMGTDLALEMLLEAEIDQRVKTIHGLDPDVAATSTIATIGSAEFDEFFPPERNCARTAIAGTNIDFCFVEKFHLAAVSLVLRNVIRDFWTPSLAFRYRSLPLRSKIIMKFVSHKL
ncbi:hypothetical protein D3C71_1020730 [compost metagenome]